jgi:hypothetical protein
METNLVIDVTDLDSAHRRALEDVIGTQLQHNQRVVIRVTTVEPNGAERRVQTLDELPDIYKGLSEEQVEAVDRDIKTRANLTRDMP